MKKNNIYRSMNGTAVLGRSGARARKGSAKAQRGSISSFLSTIKINKKTRDMILRGVFIVAAAVGLIMAQHLILMQLDSRVTARQAEYNTIKALNDSKERDLVVSRSYENIVPAAKSYGMTEITTDQKIAISVKKQADSDKDFDQDLWYN